MPKVSKGTIYRRDGSPNWSIKFYLDGVAQRETTATADRDQALEFLRRRIDEAENGRFTPIAKRPTFDDLRTRLLENYEFKRNKTSPSVQVNRLREFFGQLLAEDITDERIVEYSAKRLRIDRVEPATLRRELAILKRMLRLCSSRLPRIPVIDMPRVDNARQGFFEKKELRRILPQVPLHARYLVLFLYFTGWRSSEAFRLQWNDVDWEAQAVTLRDSKTREPRMFPFKYNWRVETVLRRQRAEVSRWELENTCLCTSVFHWNGKPIRKLRRSWTSACRRAGLPGRYLHDFRRTAVRNLIRAGVQQSIAMKITGHKTDSIFRRYLIVDEELLAQATGALSDFMDDEDPEPLPGLS
jgi:integrase